MYTPFLHTLDQLLGWRRDIESRADDLLRFLADHDLADATPAARLRALRERMSTEKLLVAFVAEFSRGKSELINAIFFSDTGQRILPATPGRTTMSPVELGYHSDRPAEMAMLPIETRLDSRTLSEWRAQPAQWQRVPLEVDSPKQLAEALLEVKRTTRVGIDMARQLGFWDEEHPVDNPPLDDAGQVEVPAWRHVLINYPHPLLEQGLVVLDTPGLNAIGAEPELTLNLLPSAHATVFILGADTGVTRSDLAIWRDHLAVQNTARYVVLNKIDTLADPLATVEETQRQLESQREDVARTLAIPPSRVFPLSARQALIGRVSRDTALQTASRLGALEFALQADLLPKRRQLLEAAVVADSRDIESQVERVIADRRRQLAEQILELRGLRGKSASKVRLMLKRVDEETADFERCTTKLQALRLVHNRVLKEALAPLAGDRLRLEFSKMQADLKASLLNLGGRKAFAGMCERLREKMSLAQSRAAEIRSMLEASFAKLNAEYGFALALAEGPSLQNALEELALIERNYAQYLGLSQAIRLSNPAFMEQFRRMLLSKLGVVFEAASGEIETWSRSASAQIEAQLRERRSVFRRRRESLERIQSAADDLEGRLLELEGSDRHLQALLQQLQTLCDRVRQAAMATPPNDPAWMSTSVLQMAAQA
jgi:hypothetical protein